MNRLKSFDKLCITSTKK